MTPGMPRPTAAGIRWSLSIPARRIQANGSGRKDGGHRPVPGGTPGRAPLTVGDVNNDGIFDSADLASVLQAGEYEDDQIGNSSFAEGDWDGDGDFTTSDLVRAFRAGTYVAASRPHDLSAANTLFADPRRPFLNGRSNDLSDDLLDLLALEQTDGPSTVGL